MTTPLYATPRSSVHYMSTPVSSSLSTYYTRLAQRRGAWRSRHVNERDTIADAVTSGAVYGTLSCKTPVSDRVSASHSRLQSMAHECNELASLLTSYYSANSSRDMPAARQLETDAEIRQSISSPTASTTPGERRSSGAARHRRRTLTAPRIIVDEDGDDIASRSMTQPSLEETGVEAAASRRRATIPPPPRADDDAAAAAVSPRAYWQSTRQKWDGVTSSRYNRSSSSPSGAGNERCAKEGRAPTSPHPLCEQMLQWLLFLFENRQQQIDRIDRVESALLHQDDFAQRCTSVTGLLRRLHRLVSRLQSTPAARTATRCVEVSNLLSQLVAAEDRLVADMLNSAASFATEATSCSRTQSSTETVRYAALQQRYDAVIAENALLRRQTVLRVANTLPRGGNNNDSENVGSPASSDEDGNVPLPLSMTAVHRDTRTIDNDANRTARRKGSNDCLPWTVSSHEHCEIDGTRTQQQQLMAAQLENDTLRASIATLRDTLVRHRAVIRLLSQSSMKVERGATGRVAASSLTSRGEDDVDCCKDNALGLIENILAGKLPPRST